MNKFYLNDHTIHYYEGYKFIIPKKFSGDKKTNIVELMKEAMLYAEYTFFRVQPFENPVVGFIVPHLHSFKYDFIPIFQKDEIVYENSTKLRSLLSCPEMIKIYLSYGVLTARLIFECVAFKTIKVWRITVGFNFSERENEDEEREKDLMRRIAYLFMIKKEDICKNVDIHQVFINPETADISICYDPEEYKDIQLFVPESGVPSLLVDQASILRRNIYELLNPINVREYLFFLI